LASEYCPPWHYSTVDRQQSCTYNRRAVLVLKLVNLCSLNRSVAGLGIRNQTPFTQQPGFPVLLLQASVGLLVAVLFVFGKGLTAGYSALFGGLIALLPNAFFAYKAFRYFGARSTKDIVLAIWSGAMGKWILTAVLFALLFVGIRQLDIAALFVGYLLAVAAAASAPLLIKNF
jgi:ATP synthase protein I